MSTQLRDSLKGMLESYDLMVENCKDADDSVFLGVIKGFFVYEPERARKALAESHAYDVAAVLAENRRLRELRAALVQYLEEPSTDGRIVRRVMRERLKQLVKIPTSTFPGSLGAPDPTSPSTA